MEPVVSQNDASGIDEQSSETHPPPWTFILWQFLHGFSLYIDNYGTVLQKEKWINVLETSDTVMFCMKCKNHFNQYKQEHPIRNAASSFEWTVHLHNSVNIKLNKNTMSFDDAHSEWTRRMPMNTSMFNSSILRTFINAYSTQVNAIGTNCMDYVEYYLKCMDIVYDMPDKSNYVELALAATESSSSFEFLTDFLNLSGFDQYWDKVMEANMPKNYTNIKDPRTVTIVPVDFIPITYEDAMLLETLQDQQIYAFIVLESVEQAYLKLQNILDMISLKAPSSTLFIHIHYLINQEPCSHDDCIQRLCDELYITHSSKVPIKFVYNNKCLNFDDHLYSKSILQTHSESVRFAEDNLINIFLTARDVDNHLPMYESFRNYVWDNIRTDGIKVRLEVSRTHLPKISDLTSLNSNTVMELHQHWVQRIWQRPSS